ncbi:hypothetical protein Tcan_14638 [Toxocara canis]|uniref:Uncharacterized protein n=1 Tax=Toxocara canis TaxID=6265 RepID=A0A0B2V417_TOXCA|nr:hypothetical protein Tcan_14638 [Toxocara canis]
MQCSTKLQVPVHNFYATAAKPVPRTSSIIVVCKQLCTKLYAIPSAKLSAIFSAVMQSSDRGAILRTHCLEQSTHISPPRIVTPRPQCSTFRKYQHAPRSTLSSSPTCKM